MTPSCETARPNTLEPQAPADAATEQRTAEAVLLEIRLDTLDHPKRYLEEILVPFGGE